MAKGTYPSDRQDQYMVRFPDGLRDRIKATAEKNGRSMNTEIVLALEEAFPVPVTTEELLHDISHAIKAVRNFREKESLMVLADDLDRLVDELSHSSESSEEARAAAREYVDEHAKYIRRLEQLGKPGKGDL